MSKSEPDAAVQTDIDITEVLRLIPHRYPMLLVDRAEAYRAHQSIVGIKSVSINEPFFVGHFPTYPVMPGVLIVEAIAQTGAVLMSKSLNVEVEGKTILFMSLDNGRFRHPVLRARGGVFKFRGRALVGDKLAAEVEFAAMVVETPE
jgi:3-hydroxyacyl-[acyl-carrier-protein] dehydratase